MSATNNDHIHQGLIMPVDESDVDTDKIIPAQFLTTVVKQGLGKHCFDRVRNENPRAYPIDDPKYKGASVMLCRPNFGCGSSREHAVWAIMDAGFKVLIGSTFLDIFGNNAQLNGLWVVRLPEPIINRLFDEAAVQPQSVQVDIQQCTVELPWDEDVSFSVDPFYKGVFTKGVDPLSFVRQDMGQATQKYEDRLATFPKGVFVR